jgi:hypothetical protein
MNGSNYKFVILNTKQQNKIEIKKKKKISVRFLSFSDL